MDNLQKNNEVGKGRSSNLTVFFEGQIPEAIKAAQSTKKILIVYIAGDDEDSSKMDQITWQDPKVCQTVSQNYVALSLTQGSEGAGHFLALYPCHQFPAVTLVSHTGMLLKQFGGYVTPSELLARLEEAAAELHLKNTAAMMAALASVKVEPPSASSLENQMDRSTLENGTSSLMTITDALSSNSENQISSLMMVADEHCSISEHEIRTVAQENEADDSKIVVEEPSLPVPSGNAEGNLDHGSVSSKEAAFMQNTCKAFKKMENSPLTENKRENLASTLLQIRLTNGEKLQHKFDPKDSLSMVKEFVDKNRTDGSFDFDLAVLYPRRVFHNEELKMSLLDLNLEDRATLITMRKSTVGKSLESECTIKESGIPSSGQHSRSLLWRLISYLNPFSYFSGEGMGNSVETDEIQADIDGYSTLQNNHINVMNGRKAGDRGKSTSWGSNIHTLRHDDDNDAFKKGNAFWNGNSTQYGGDDSKN